MPKLGRKRFESRDRRSERYGKIGRDFEKQLAGMLEKWQEEKLISGYVFHDPGSQEDHAGRDFTVRMALGGREIERSFGVTISMKSWQDAKILHPDVPQFCFPIGTKPETIRARILELFS